MSTQREALEALVAEHQWNALEMARKADAAERRAEEAEFHVEQLREARDRAERKVEAAEALADEWREDYPSDLAACNRTADQWWRDLLVALTGKTECSDLCGEHHWLDRPESDTRECLICGAEVAG